jgi:hypothetical protein
MLRRDQIAAPESSNYVTIYHPDRPLLISDGQLVTPWRAGRDDASALLYANPFSPGSVAWSQYEHGSQSARQPVDC